MFLILNLLTRLAENHSIMLDDHETYIVKNKTGTGILYICICFKITKDAETKF